ncbi:unnamed protein product [Cercospora beticola]|nr:unnamed protein product [Cercospora beticola]
MATGLSFSLFLFSTLWQLTAAIPAPSFVGVLTDLPTLAPVSYCTEVIGDGIPDVLHTKTGLVCTYNSIRSKTIPSSTTTFTASFPEQAAPSNQGNARTFPSAPDATGGAQPFSDQLDGKCTIFQRKTFDQYGKWDWRPIDEELSKQQCVSFCAKAFAENLANNQTAANACISWADPPAWENYNFVEWFANTAVPAIEKIACKTWITGISTVVTGGLAAIPGVGGAVATVAHAAMQAAVTLAYTMESAQDAGQGFTDWLNAPSTQAIDGACGNKYTSEEGQRVFEAFWTAASAVGPAKIFANAARNFPPSWAKGSGASKDLTDYLSGLVPGKGKGGKDDRPERPSPSPSAPSKPTDQTKSAESSQSPKQCTKKHDKRAPKGLYAPQSTMKSCCES